MKNKILIEFKEPKYGKESRVVLYINDKRIDFISFEKKAEIENKIQQFVKELSILN